MFVINSIAFTFFLTGESLSTGMPVPCEVAKAKLTRKIQGITIDTKALKDFEQFEEIPDESVSDPVSGDIAAIFDSTELNIISWSDDIEHEARDTAAEDDGNRDNIMENGPFAKHLLRLLKMLPLFSRISNKFFNSSFSTGTSWSSETWFENLKQMHAEEIPCSVDEFIKQDIKLTDEEK